MSSTNLQGPFLLTAERLSMAVASRKLPGVYVLGHTDDEANFIVECVGRSDENLRERLQDHADCFQLFAFEFCVTPKAAFEKECGLYHKLVVEMNLNHPTRPDESYWKCPQCSVFD